MSDPSDIVHDSSQLAHHSQVCIIRFYIPPPSLTIPQYQLHCLHCFSSWVRFACHQSFLPISCLKVRGALRDFLPCFWLQNICLGCWLQAEAAWDAMETSTIFHQVFLQQLISRYKVGLKSLVATRTTKTIERHWFSLNLSGFVVEKS